MKDQEDYEKMAKDYYSDPELRERLSKEAEELMILETDIDENIKD